MTQWTALNQAATLVLPYNPVYDVFRVIAVFGSLFALILLASTYKRRPSNMLAGAMVFVVLTGAGEAQQIGEDFIVFQLPLRLLGVWLFYRAWRKGEHRTRIAQD